MGDVFHPSQPLPPSGSSSLQPLLLLILKHGPLESSGVCGLDTAPLPRRAELENPPTAPHLDLAAVPTNPGGADPCRPQAGRGSASGHPCNHPRRAEEDDKRLVILREETKSQGLKGAGDQFSASTSKDTKPNGPGSQHRPDTE